MTRVQIPAAFHLMRMGYTYLPCKREGNCRKRSRDEYSGIYFREQFLKFNNYANDVDVERELSNIKLELDQNDLGRAFYKRIIGETKCDLYWLEHPEANTFHVALEVTYKNGRDEFRPDLVVFINGIPISYIEVKQPNAIRDGKTGVHSEQDRTKQRFENRKFRRFNNITQLIALSDNLPYISGQGQQNKVLIMVRMPIQKPSLMPSRKKEKRFPSFLCYVNWGANRLRLKWHEPLAPQISTRALQQT